MPRQTESEDSCSPCELPSIARNSYTFPTCNRNTTGGRHRGRRFDSANGWSSPLWTGSRMTANGQAAAARHGGPRAPGTGCRQAGHQAGPHRRRLADRVRLRSRAHPGHRRTPSRPRRQRPQPLLHREHPTARLPAGGRRDAVAASVSPGREVSLPFKLLGTDGDVPLSQGPNIVGRTGDADICIDRTEVSRCHARIMIAGTTATIEDLGSQERHLPQR